MITPRRSLVAARASGRPLVAACRPRWPARSARSPSTHRVHIMPDEPDRPAALARVEPDQSLDLPGTPTPSAPPAIVYPYPILDGSRVHQDLREASGAACQLVRLAGLLLIRLQGATGPFSTPGTATYNQGTPDERVVVLPPIVVVAAEEIVQLVVMLDKVRIDAEDKIFPVRLELIDHGELYSHGDIHASCAHDATLGYADQIRRMITAAVGFAAKDYSGIARFGPSGLEELPPSLIRDHWKAFLTEFKARELEARHSAFDGPTRDRLLELVKREAVKAANARHRSPPQTPTLNPPTTDKLHGLLDQPLAQSLAARSTAPALPSTSPATDPKPIRLWVKDGNKHCVEILRPDGTVSATGTVRPKGYEVLRVLLAAFPTKIGSDQLKEIDGGQTALKDVRQSFPAMEQVIDRPNDSGRKGFYGLKWPNNPEPRTS